MISKSTSSNLSLDNQVENKHKNRDEKVITLEDKLDLIDFLKENMFKKKFESAYRLTFSAEALELYENEFGYVPNDFLLKI